MWVDLSSPDLEGSKSFYGRLFGWQAQTVPDPKAGGYTFFTHKGKQVAGVGPIQGPGQPPAWSVYIATENVEATARKVRDAGGKVIAEPLDVMNAGRMAVFQDPTGAFISVWQSREHKGAELANEPNTFGWTELSTRDIPAAKTFYKKVFGWGDKTTPMGPGGSGYTEWQLGGKSIGGAMPMSDQTPASVPPNWLTYFLVTSVDAASDKARSLGAKITVPPMDFPGGRFAVITDPQGATFGLFAAKA